MEMSYFAGRGIVYLVTTEETDDSYKLHISRSFNLGMFPNSTASPAIDALNYAVNQLTGAKGIQKLPSNHSAREGRKKQVELLLNLDWRFVGKQSLGLEAKSVDIGLDKLTIDEFVEDMVFENSELSR